MLLVLPTMSIDMYQKNTTQKNTTQKKQKIKVPYIMQNIHAILQIQPIQIACGQCRLVCKLRMNLSSVNKKIDLNIRN